MSVNLPDLDRRWMTDAACRGMPSSVFFPEPDDENFVARPLAYRKAKAVCRRCPVLELCQRDTLGEQDGIWGGMEPRERRKLRRERSVVVNLWADADKRAYGEMIDSLRPRYVWSEISRMMGLNLTAVLYLHQWLEAEIKSRPAPALRVSADVSHKTPAAKVEEIIQLRDEGMSQRGIAKELDLTTNTVRKYLMEHDLESPRVVLPFPDNNPAWEDGWCRHIGRIVAGTYRGQNEDGSWYLMAIHTGRGQSAIAWFRKDDVKLTRDVAVVIKKRQGDRGRIYGYTA